ncbi:MASE1 domain-containing protein [Burkholderia pseudomallei]|uniref:MASE1 domain-containing protein n=1 Tax=Burkholderia pseudomallei TaxID=28450 RepID=UPI0003113F84|nr:MASE1 domain-containing protein [Burkholderia pseudomallei]
MGRYPDGLTGEHFRHHHISPKGHGMGNGGWRRDWLKQLAVAVGYALIYIAMHPVSDGHWALRSGLRLSCLLVMPYRYWPVLLLAEALPNAYEVWPCRDLYGLAFVSIRCIPPILLAMPIVAWCRRKLRLFPAPHLVDMKVLMLCVLTVTVIGTVYSYLAISFIHTASFHARPVMAIGYFIGNFIAILGTVPVVLMMKLDARAERWVVRLHRVASSRMAIDVVLFVVPSIAVLSVLSLHGDNDMRQIARMAMFLPVAWVTLKYGWRAAVVGGALAVVSTCLTTQSRPDPQILEAQAFIALAITCLMATGARISVQLRRDELKRREDIHLRRMARQGLRMVEQRRRQTSEALECLAGSLYLTNSRLMQQLRRVVPGSEMDAYQRQLADTQQRVYALAESLHPVAWRDRGLPAALNQTIARALDEAGIAYRCVISGRGFARMSTSVLGAAYRSACEGVVLVTRRLACSRVGVTLRGGETRGKRWLLLRVEGLHDDDRIANAVVRSTERKQIATKLGASVLDVDQLHAHARIFDGTLHERAMKNGVRMTILLYDVRQDVEGSGGEPEPLRLWVH